MPYPPLALSSQSGIRLSILTAVAPATHQFTSAQLLNPQQHRIPSNETREDLPSIPNTPPPHFLRHAPGCRHILTVQPSIPVTISAHPSTSPTFTFLTSIPTLIPTDAVTSLLTPRSIELDHLRLLRSILCPSPPHTRSRSYRRSRRMAEDIIEIVVRSAGHVCRRLRLRYLTNLSRGPTSFCERFARGEEDEKEQEETRAVERERRCQQHRPWSRVSISSELTAEVVVGRRGARGG